MTETIEIKKDTLTKGIIGLLGILLIISIFTGGFGIKKNSITGDAVLIDDSQKPTPTTAIDMKDLIDDDSIKGNKEAQVTIIEFSDYECPFCGRFYSQAYQDIVTKYIDTGKVNLVFRDFPLSFHQHAQKAAEAAECAGEQNQYYEMHNLLFEKGVSGGIDAFKEYAKELELNQDEFNSCLDSGKMAEEIKKDFTDGQKAGVKGTPAFLINGKLISGAQPFNVFEEAIEAALA